MSWLLTYPKRKLYIAAIGAPKAGKTTALKLLAEIICEKYKYAISSAKSEMDHTVVLTDVPELTKDAYDRTLKGQPDIFTIKVSKKSDELFHWSVSADTDAFIWNEGDDFRLFEKQLEDMFKAEIMMSKKWKRAFNI